MLTRAQITEILVEAGCPPEAIKPAVSKLIDGHSSSITAIQEERDQYKKIADTLPEIQKKLEELESKDAEGWQKKYEDEHNSFEAFKTKINDDAVLANKEKRFIEDVLKPIGIDEKRIKAILRVADIKGIDLNDKGEIKDLTDVISKAKEEWSDFIVVNKQGHTEPETPPTNAGAEKHGRALEIANQYHKNLYGEKKEEK